MLLLLLVLEGRQICSEPRSFIVGFLTTTRHGWGVQTNAVLRILTEVAQSSELWGYSLVLVHCNQTSQLVLQGAWDILSKDKHRVSAEREGAHARNKNRRKENMKVAKGRRLLMRRSRTVWAAHPNESVKMSFGEEAHPPRRRPRSITDREWSWFVGRQLSMATITPHANPLLRSSAPPSPRQGLTPIRMSFKIILRTLELRSILLE